MVPRAERPIPRHITCNDSDQNHLNFHIIRTRDARDYNIYDRDSMEVYHNYSPQMYYLSGKEAVHHHMSDKDTNEDSDEDRNQTWEAQTGVDLTARGGRQGGNKKLKNQLCRNFMKYGACNYGFKCQFAHGIDELRKNENQNSKYKTKECTSYYKDGYCTYGVRCNFLHNHKQGEGKKCQKKVMGRFDGLLRNYPELVAVERPRLRFFERIEEKY